MSNKSSIASLDERKKELLAKRGALSNIKQWIASNPIRVDDLTNSMAIKD